MVSCMQMGAQVATLQQQLSALMAGQDSAEQQRRELDAQHEQQLAALRQELEAMVGGLEELRCSLAESGERGDMVASLVEGMRSELLVLAGQRDVVSSRLEALEVAVGLEAGAATPMVGSPVGMAAAAAVARRSSGAGPDEGAGLDATAEDGQHHSGMGAGEERGGSTDGGERSPSPDRLSADGSGWRAAAESAARRREPRGHHLGGSSLLELVAELRVRLTAVEGAAEAATADLEQVTCLGAWGSGRARGVVCPVVGVCVGVSRRQPIMRLGTCGTRVIPHASRSARAPYRTATRNFQCIVYIPI